MSVTWHGVALKREAAVLVERRRSEVENGVGYTGV